MKQTIGLDLYLNMGGCLDYLPIKDTHVTASSCCDKVVSKVELGGLNRDSSSQLYMVTFDDGYQHQFHPMWIEVKVDLELNGRYM